MKKIGFMGALDKSDLIVNIAKILQILGNRVLVIDSSSIQKIKYIIPSIKPTKSYITTFEEIDFGIGFQNWEEVEKYLGIRFVTNEESINDQNITTAKEKVDEKNDIYDYILIDVDSQEGLRNFTISNAERNYFLTKFDRFCLTKGMEIFQNLEEPIELTKVLFSYISCTKDDEAYLDFISSYYQINWNDYEMYFKISGEDNQVFEENQRIEKIRFRRLSQGYKDSLAYIVQDICKSNNIGKIKKAMKD